MDNEDVILPRYMILKQQYLEYHVPLYEIPRAKIFVEGVLPTVPSPKILAIYMPIKRLDEEYWQYEYQGVTIV